MSARLLLLCGLLLLAFGCGGSGGAAPTQVAPPATGCARTSVGFTPLPDLVGGSYQG